MDLAQKQVDTMSTHTCDSRTENMHQSVHLRADLKFDLHNMQQR